MNQPSLTRRRLLAAGATTGTAALAYGTDTPLHRSTKTNVTTHSADEAPARGAFWHTEHAPESSDADVTQFLGVRYLGRSGGADQFDVLVVTVGRQSTLFERGPLVDSHRLGLRGTGDTSTRGVDEGDAQVLVGGAVPAPERLVAETSLDRADLDDASALDDRVGPSSQFGTDHDLRTARLLFEEFDPDRDTLAGSRLTLAGLLYGLGTGTAPKEATPQYEGRGETYRWTPGNAVAHVARYRSLAVHPGEETLGLKVASAVPRPSLLGSPRFETAVVLRYPSGGAAGDRHG